ncbi:MAG: cytochrome C [Phenylobacterium sp.]|uniref:cytochrome c3 family protein n=1 Tax=Phenylobacterium sp. TaxID=1871053 RepID=UPI0025E19489|nr:cytochrome c3 family protein [Phenylobacterium sp.]MBI1200220.1 cytochrome C [Phenylobacterium sp.]
MPQIFKPSADTWLRTFAAVAALGLIAAALFGAGVARSDWVTRAGWPVEQPVPFSHKHHVGDLGLDCRYCHSDVEEGRYAGLPSSHVCITCHSQLWTGAEVLEPVRASFAENRPIAWKRVAALPEYVYFDHHIHVARGVPCVECHGRIDEMPLTWRAKPLQMRFCIDCHRDPAPRLRPVNQVTRMDWTGWASDPANRGFGERAMRRFHIQPAKLTDCNVCHR